MKLLIAILALLTLTSCAQQEIPQQNEPHHPPPTTEQPNKPDPPPNNTMNITIGSTVFTATIAANASVTAFKAMLPLTLNMNDYNSNEKVADLPNSMPTTGSNPGTIYTGDIMLYGSSSLVVFYKTFSTSYSYTRIGRIDNMVGLKTALGSGSVTMKFELE